MQNPNSPISFSRNHSLYLLPVSPEGRVLTPSIQTQQQLFQKQTPAHNTQPSTSPSMGAIKKVRRCKFCRSKAKYLPGQRSLDAVSAKIFRRKKTPESSRRAASEDRYTVLSNLPLRLPVLDEYQRGRLAWNKHHYASLYNIKK